MRTPPGYEMRMCQCGREFLAPAGSTRRKCDLCAPTVCTGARIDPRRRKKHGRMEKGA